jgi:hypothetical protein
MREPAGENALDLAVKRLDRALALLEQRLAAQGAGAETGGLFDQDRSKLAAELDQARAREKELEVAGAEASAALGRAIAEIKTALASAPTGLEEAAEALQGVDQTEEA